MDENTFYIIQIISTFSIVPALVLGFVTWRRVDRLLLFFLGFLLLGFLVDLFGWYAYLHQLGRGNLIIRNGYSLIECLFVFWLVGSQISTGKIAVVTKHAWIFFLPFWAVTLAMGNDLNYFMLAFQILVSFALSIVILQRVETGKDIWQQPLFPILVGAFINYFCTFVFMNFLDSKIGMELWYVRNIISASANLFYAWAFWLSFRPKQSAN